MSAQRGFGIRSATQGRNLFLKVHPTCTPGGPILEGNGAFWMDKDHSLTTKGESKGFFRAFLDFFILFSGISTARNLERTQGKPLRTRGLFLFRSDKGR